jgi:Notch-like protein
VSGYTGSICETDIDECASTPCLNGGTCTQGVASYTCTCAAGFADVPVGTCFSELDECSSSPCLNGGTCFDHTFAYSCVCAKGYAGYNCEVNPNECASSPCMNGTTCTDRLNA